MIRLCLCLLATLSWQSGALAKNFLEDYLPDTTLISLSLKDADSLVEALESGALAKLIPPEKKEEWLEESEKPIEDSEGERYVLPSGKDLSIRNLNELLNGRICVSITSFDLHNDMEPNIVLLADFAGDIDAWKFLQLTDRDVESDKVLLEEENYAGVTLFSEEVDLDDEDYLTEYWALVNGIAIETSSMELLKNTVDAIIDARGLGLGDSEPFQRAVDLSPSAQIRFFMNLQEGTRMLRTMMEEDGMDELPMNPLAVTMDSLWSSLSLESMTGLFGAYDFESEHIESTFGLLYNERDGVLGLLAYSQNPIEYPHWVPLDAIDSTVSMTDFPGVFEAFESMMNDMSPNFGTLFALQLDNMKQQTNIDLRESLFNNFGEQFISFSILAEASDDDYLAVEDREKMVIAIPIRDPQAFQNSVKGLTELFMPGAQLLEEREFLDLKIVTFANQEEEDAVFGYALADGYLFLGFGSVKLLERTLYNVRESSEGLWNQTTIVEALADMPPNPVGSGYYDLGSVLKELYRIYEEELSMGDNDWDLPDLADFELPYFIISSAYILEDAQIVRARILPKNP